MKTHPSDEQPKQNPVAAVCDRRQWRQEQTAAIVRRHRRLAFQGSSIPWPSWALSVVVAAVFLLMTPSAPAQIRLPAPAFTQLERDSQRRQYESLTLRPDVPLSVQSGLPVAEDDEMGKQFLLRPRAVIPQFSAAADAQYFYNDNPRLIDGDGNDDFLFVGSGTLAWNPTWIKGVTGSVFLRQQFFRYNKNTDLDFDATSVGLVAGTAVKDWFNVNLGYTATRLQSRPTDDEFYKEGDASLVISRIQQFGQRCAMPYGYTFDFYHTSPGAFTRLTHGLFTGLNYVITPKLLAQFYYRFQFEDYLSINRQDHAHILSAMLTYFITDWASLRGFANWTTNDSTMDQDYDILNSGVGLNLLVRF